MPCLASVGQAAVVVAALPSSAAPAVTGITRKPPTMSHAEAAALVTVGLTSLQALRWAGGLQAPASSVAGALGGCGSVGVQLARILAGAEGVVGAICGGRAQSMCVALIPRWFLATTRTRRA